MSNLHPIFAHALRPYMPPQAPQSREDVLASALAEACEALEKNARDAFVVDGIPATQEGFEAAWDDEDGPSYAQWLRLRYLVAPPARRSISMGRVG